MEEQVELLLKKLKYEYSAFWVLTCLLALLYETDVFAKGMLAEDTPWTYAMQVMGILLTVELIPLALRLFGMGMMDRVRELPLEEALLSYRRWNQVRLGVLLVVVMVNLTCYYLTMHSAGALCAVMALLASVSCAPSRSRIWTDLDLKEEGDELTDEKEKE